MTQIEHTLRQAGHMPVLLISNEKGDQFVFGTQEELENEAEGLVELGYDHELSTAWEFLNKLDLAVYDGNEPIIVR